MSECPPAQKELKALQKRLIKSRWMRSPKLLNRELDCPRWRGLPLGCWMPVLR